MQIHVVFSEFTFQYGGLRTRKSFARAYCKKQFTFQYGGLRTYIIKRRKDPRKYLHSNMED